MMHKRSFFGAIQVVPLLTCLLIYSLGVGIADYQGTPIDFRAYLLGQSWVILMQLSMTFLEEYFSFYSKRESALDGVVSNELRPFPLSNPIRKVVWWGILTSFSGAAAIGVLMLRYRLVDLTVFFLIILVVVSVIVNSMPPFTSKRSGYGEFVTAFWFVFLIPAFAYSLQDGENIQLIFFILAPLFCLHLAMQLALEMRSYKVFPGLSARNFFDHYGWQTGIQTHNICLIASVILVVLGFLWGLPKFIPYIAVGLIPFGVFQVYQMRRILSGGKPAWKLIGLIAYSLFFLGAYLFSYAFWVQ